MKTDKIPQPTIKQQYWLDHINAAKAQKLSLKDYGKREGLHVQTLYSYKSSLSKKGYLVGSSKPVFAKVVTMPKPVVAAPPLVRIFLANGIRVEIASDGTSVTALLKTVSQL